MVVGVFVVGVCGFVMGIWLYLVRFCFELCFRLWRWLLIGGHWFILATVSCIELNFKVVVN